MFTYQQASQPFSYLASPRLHSLDTVPDGLSVTVSLRSLPQRLTCQLVLLPVWYRAKRLASLLQMLPPLLPNHSPQSLSSAYPPRGKQAPILVPTLSQLRSLQTQPGRWSGKGHAAGETPKHTPTITALAQFDSNHLVQDLGLMVVEQGGWRGTSGRLAFPAQLRGC